MNTTADSGRRPLTKLYLTRGVLAVAWAAAFAQADKNSELDKALGATAIVLLIAYPLLDAVSSAIDHRSVPDRVTAFNGILSTAAAIGVGIAGATNGTRATLAVFGGLSFIVGIFYAAQAAGHKPSLSVLSVYATGGGVFFIVQAGLLAWRARRGMVQPV